MNNYLLTSISLVLVSSLSQVLLKSSANEVNKNKLKLIFNCKVIVSYFILFTVTFINSYYVFANLKLTTISMIETLGYIFVPIISMIFLKEKINLKTTIGIIFIFVGCIVFIRV